MPEMVLNKHGMDEAVGKVADAVSTHADGDSKRRPSCLAKFALTSFIALAKSR